MYFIEHLIILYIKKIILPLLKDSSLYKLTKLLIECKLHKFIHHLDQIH